MRISDWSSDVCSSDLRGCSEESSFPELVAAVYLDRRPAFGRGDPDDVWKSVDVACLQPVRFIPHDRRLVVRCAVELVTDAQKFAGEIIGDRRRFSFALGLCGCRLGCNWRRSAERTSELQPLVS